MTAHRIDGSVIRQNVCQPLAPSVRAACSCSSPISRSVGHDLARDEGDRDEDRRDHHRGQGEQHHDAAVREPASEPALLPVEQEEREPDDDGREGERQVDERVQDALAREPPAHDRERTDDSEDRVHGHGDGGDDQGQLEAR